MIVTFHRLRLIWLVLLGLLVATRGSFGAVAVYDGEGASALAAKTGAVKPYEVGTADALRARSVKGDGLDVHCWPSPSNGTTRPRL
jgi:hypothetical protein